MITKDFGILLRELQCSNNSFQPTILKEIVAAVYAATESDIQELLELLTWTPAVNIQIRLLTVLSSYLLSNGIHYGIIVKFSPMYETVQQLLGKCLPMKTKIPLNFISTVLCLREDGGKCLVQYAQNMLRTSNCLLIMSEMFVESMMSTTLLSYSPRLAGGLANAVKRCLFTAQYQDIWVALCHSLAETCRSSEINQNYCSHLVPLCIQRCRKGNMDVCSVLQSLLQKNERNSKLFLDNGGLTIFTRQMLQYNMGIQLLSTIVEQSAQAVSMLKNTDIVFHLREFLRLYGPSSQMGQWSTIILFYLETHIQSQLRKTTSSRYGIHNDFLMENTKSITLQKRTDPKPIFIPEHERILKGNDTQRFDAKYDRGEKINKFEEKEPAYNDPDNTYNLYNNILREIIYWKGNKELPQPAMRNTLNSNRSGRQTSNIKGQTLMEQTLRQVKSNRDLIFSFTTQENPNYSKITVSYCNKDQASMSVLAIQTQHTNFDSSLKYQDQTSLLSKSSLDLDNFIPPFVSTPKRETFNSYNTKKTYSSRKCRKNKISNKPMIVQNNEKETIRRSMSARLFSAINESCTTFVKSVRDIFRKKQKSIENMDDSKLYDYNDGSCSYSFTNYMCRRDEILNRESAGSEYSSDNYKLDSCKTCKDTIILQQKLSRNESLKQTVKRLKIGVYLYGCDFKKISKLLWPQDRTMTPKILQNLYRKLIVNGGHDNHEFRQKAQVLKRKYRP